jgi:hypothetical protein
MFSFRPDLTKECLTASMPSCLFLRFVSFPAMVVLFCIRAADTARLLQPCIGRVARPSALASTDTATVSSGYGEQIPKQY